MRNQITVSKPLSMKRLARDYQELKNSEIPLVGVAGVPDEHDLRFWHVNIRAPDNSPWKGAVFHLLMFFPTNYPVKPPTIEVMTPLSHPCVKMRAISRLVSLDQLEEKSKDPAKWYEGWQSAYTVESLLVQLQAFLFEKNTDSVTAAEM